MNQNQRRSQGLEASNCLLPVPKWVPVYKSDKEAANNSSKPDAKCVLIGNLHDDLKQCNVYDLCVKANVKPQEIVMGKVKHPNYRVINYAFVYMKTDDDVKNLVSGLNNLVLGRQLIVYSEKDCLEIGRKMMQSAN